MQERFKPSAHALDYHQSHQSRSQRPHSSWSAPRVQDLCQNAGESKSDWLLCFTGNENV